MGDLAHDCRLRFNVANVIKAVVYQRVLEPGSDRSLVRSFLSSVFAPEFGGTPLQHAYRALQLLADVGPKLPAPTARVPTRGSSRASPSPETTFAARRGGRLCQ